MRLGILTALLILFHMQHVFHCSRSVVPGYLDFDNLPDTNFSCEGKVIGGYYADIETGCQMFHVCTIGQKGEVTDIKFLCLNGTVFDQETRVCERVDEVDCSKTEGFYDLNLELYGNNAALSFPEEETDENAESQNNAETNDGSSSKHKTSTSKPLTTSPSSTPLTPHPASTTTPKIPIHPFVPTTTASPYKPSQHITHFHSTTAPSIAAFLAINNAFSSANSNQDDSSQYDDDEEEEEADSITDHPGIGDTNHHFPPTTISSQIRPIGPEQHSVLQSNVKVQGTGESGFILNQQQQFQSQKPPATSTQSAHLYSHSYHPTSANVKNPNAHSKHHLNTQLILNQQRETESKEHLGFKPDNRNQFLYSSTTRQPPIFYTTKSPTGFSTTLHSQSIEPFSLHGIGPQPPIQTTQQTPSNSPFPLQTNAHQVPANPLAHQIRSNIANNGGYLTQTIQLSQNPLTFQFNSNNNNRQGNQLFTTPSVAVIATTSSTSSSSSIKTNPTVKNGNISPEISLTSSIGNNPKGSDISNNSSVSAQIFSETTSPSYDEYQEGDVSSDPFFRDVPKISKPSTQLKSPAPTRHGVVRRKRGTLRNKHEISINAQISKPHILRNKRRAQVGLPTEIFGTGEGRYRNRQRDQSSGYGENTSRQGSSRVRNRIDSHSRRTSVTEPSTRLVPSVHRSRSRAFHTTTPESTTLIPEVPQQTPQFSSLDIPSPSSTTKHPESAILESPVQSDTHREHRRKVLKAVRPHINNSAEADSQNSPSLHAPMIHDPDLHQDLQATSASRLVESYDTQLAPDNLESHHVPVTRTRSNAENRRQPARSRSNLEHESFTEPIAVSRQRGRPRIGSASRHEAEANVDTVRTTSRRVDHSHSNAELSDRHSPRTRSRVSSASRGRGRNLNAAHPSQDILRSRTATPNPVTETSTDLVNGTTSLPPPPLPKTNFTCADKIAGGYYADLEADCQLFHICSLGRHGRMQDNKFLCGPGTRFNQLSRTCQARDLVDCSRSASLYHLNNHFHVHPEVDVSKYQIDFDAKKVRTKRKAPKAGSISEQQYSLDDLPETSFTCADKPQDGLYADVETQCHVFHLCRTISGVLTLESSFVCPPGTVFNQPEGNCDTTKEVDCALYSAPEHNFRKTSSSGHNNQGSKTRTKRHDIFKGSQTTVRSFKLKKNTNFKKLAAQTNKKHRVKRDESEKKKTINLYDYVDDNYEAHLSKPINRPDVSEPKKDNPSDSQNHEDYEDDYDYDATVKETEIKVHKNVQQIENGNHNDSILEERISVDDEELNNSSHTTDSTAELQLVKSATDANKDNTTTDYEYEYEYEDETTIATISDEKSKTESAVGTENNISRSDVDTTLKVSTIENNIIQSTTEATTIENNVHLSTASTTLLDKESSGLTDKVIHSLDAKDYQDLDENTKRTKNQVTQATHLKVDSSTPSVEYEYEYYYDDEEFVDESNSTEKSDIKNKNHTSSIDISTDDLKSPRVLNSSEEISQSDGMNKDADIKERLDFPNISEKSSTTSTEEADLPLKPIPQHTTLPNLLPRDYPELPEKSVAESQTSINTPISKDIKHLKTLIMERPELPESVTDSLVIPSNERIDTKGISPDFDNEGPKFLERDLFSELFETQTNPTFLQELDRNSAVTRTQNNQQEDIQLNDDITLTSLTAQLDKKSPPILSLEITTSLPVSEELPVTNDELRTRQHLFKNEATTFVPLAEEETVAAIKHTLSRVNSELPYSEAIPDSTTASELKSYDTTVITTAEPLEETLASTHIISSPTEVTPYSVYTESTSTFAPNLKDEVATEPVTVLTSTSAPMTTIPTTIPSLFRPSKQRNVFRNRFSTPSPPPVIIQSREQVTSRKPTIKRNRNEHVPTYKGNNIRNNDAKSRKSHRFTLQNGETSEAPSRINNRRRSTTTTTIAPTLVVENPTIYDQETSSQNTVPSVHPSLLSKSQESSTSSYVASNTFKPELEFKTEFPFPSTKSSKVTVNNINKDHNSKVDAFHLTTESTDMTRLSPSESSVSFSAEDDKIQLPKDPTSATLSTLSTIHTGLINHSVINDVPVEFATGKEYTLNKKNDTTTHVFSSNDIATPIPVSSPSPFSINPSENTSPSSHIGYTLSSVNSQPSVAFDSYHTSHTTGFVCTGKELHRYHPDPDDCRMFHYCSPGFHTRQVLDFRFTCEEGTAFKADTQKCESEILIPSCKQRLS